MPEREPILRLENVTKFYGRAKAVDGSNLEVARGEIFTLLGPSGCGKTTTLRMVAGLEPLDAGRILCDGKPVADPARGIFVPPNKRNMGMVFQSYAIWPHMSVFENVAFPLRLRGVSGGELRQRVEQVLELVGMGAMIDRPAPMLSGGQQQRVAICRALVYEPQLLLLDEPFSNLDAKLRHQMRIEVKLLQRRLGISILFVTHDQVEALTLSDRIAVMNHGRIEQVARPAQMYDQPATPFVRDFLGHTVVLKGELGVPTQGKPRFVFGNGSAARAEIVSANHSLADMAERAPACLSIRPEDIEVRPLGEAAGLANAVPAVVQTLLFVGDRFEARIGLPNEESVLLTVPRSTGWAEGQRVSLHFPEDRTHIWPA